MACAAVRFDLAYAFIVPVRTSASISTSPMPASEAFAEIVRTSIAFEASMPELATKYRPLASSFGPIPVERARSSISGFQALTCSREIPTRPTICDIVCSKSPPTDTIAAPAASTGTVTPRVIWPPVAVIFWPIERRPAFASFRVFAVSERAAAMPARSFVGSVTSSRTAWPRSSRAPGIGQSPPARDSRAERSATNRRVASTTCGG
jgi:hypothetical protein